MSTILLKIIIRLLAIVAKEDDVTKEERDEVEYFLKDNINPEAIAAFMQEFDDYVAEILREDISESQETERVRDLCAKVNEEFTYQQKVVVVMEVVSIILADGSISDREVELLKAISNGFNIDKNVLKSIHRFVAGASPKALDSPGILFLSGDIKTQSEQVSLQKTFSGTLVFLHIHGDTDCYFVKYLGKENTYLSGSLLKINKPRVFPQGSSLRQAGYDPIYFSEVVNQFSETDSHHPISFEARNVDYHFPNGQPGLQNINVLENSGQLIAIMGSSGAGKSTLCNVLNGMEKPSNGQILINGIDIHRQPKKVDGMIGFVPQDDLLMEDLTSYDNLRFAAELCLEHLSSAEIDYIVLKTLSSLGLSEIKDLKVGSPLSKTISGGQRKRLNIGLELLREPSVLFVDEPTSGLSSRDAENIMDLLKELTLRGKLIFVVIHQPSSQIFKMFDKLIIMDVGGYQIYYDNPLDGVAYFTELIDLINGDPGECAECGNVNTEQIFNIIETKVVNEYGHITNQRKVSPQQWHGYYLDRHKGANGFTPVEDTPVSTLRRPNKLKQLQVFIQRDVLSKLSNKQYLAINLFEAPVLAFILAYILRYSEPGSAYSYAANLNLPAYIFMSIIVALFMGLTVSAEEIVKDRKILKREEFLNLSRSSYLFSKVVILFMISAVQTLLFVLVGNYILEIKGMFLMNWVILFSASCLANIVGLNISASFDKAITIYILIPILLIPQLILSGVVVQFDKLNPNITSYNHVPAIGDMMASRWGFEAAMVTLFKENKFEKQFYNFDKQIGEAEYKKRYYIPTIEAKLNLLTDAGADAEIREGALALIQNEIESELRLIGKDKFPEFGELSSGQMTPALKEKTERFLATLKSMYSNRYNSAVKEKEQMVSTMLATEEGKMAYFELQEKYANEAIEDIVTGKLGTDRIQEVNNRLVQKNNLIFKSPNPTHTLDFQDQFFTPSKHFLGYTFDTYYFNIGFIWFYCLLFVITLYFDVLKKSLRIFGKINPLRPKR